MQEISNPLAGHGGQVPLARCLRQVRGLQILLNGLFLYPPFTTKPLVLADGFCQGFAQVDTALPESGLVTRLTVEGRVNYNRSVGG